MGEAHGAVDFGRILAQRVAFSSSYGERVYAAGFLKDETPGCGRPVREQTDFNGSAKLPENPTLLTGVIGVPDGLRV